VGLVATLAAALAAGGCKDFFVAKQKVLVDAISSAEAVPPSGVSYRLVARRPVVNAIPVQVPVIKACVDAALSGRGMFEAPANVPSDLVIEVTFGMDMTPKVDASARETFLQLSARSNPQHSLDRATGPEVWDVRVAILGLNGRIESAMPLLASVASNYIATDTHSETKLEVPDNSPVVASVRENALKALDPKPAPAANAAPVAPAPIPAPAPGK
jgi:hypothetical protein